MKMITPTVSSFPLPPSLPPSLPLSLPPAPHQSNIKKENGHSGTARLCVCLVPCSCGTGKVSLERGRRRRRRRRRRGGVVEGKSKRYVEKERKNHQHAQGAASAMAMWSRDRRVLQPIPFHQTKERETTKESIHSIQPNTGNPMLLGCEQDVPSTSRHCGLLVKCQQPPRRGVDLQPIGMINMLLLIPSVLACIIVYIFQIFSSY